MEAFIVAPSVTSVTLDSGLEGFTRARTNTTREFCGGRAGVGLISPEIFRRESIQAGWKQMS